MKPASFKYVAAASVDHALSLKAEHGDDAKFLAGGQSLMPKPRPGCCFVAVAGRCGDFATVGVAAMMTLGECDECTDVRLAFCGVGDTPIDASSVTEVLVGGATTEAPIRDVAASVQRMI